MPFWQPISAYYSCVFVNFSKWIVSSQKCSLNALMTHIKCWKSWKKSLKEPNKMGNLCAEISVYFGLLG
jgi:hypothetical protein